MDDVDSLQNDVSNLHIDAQNVQTSYAPSENHSHRSNKSQPHRPTFLDVTEQFGTAARELKTGQLIKDDDFTLFEAVGALEIMDPKMDSGFLADGETLEDDYDVLRKLLPEEVIGIIDQLLCFEMAWHIGYPLSQTLFTSLYIDCLLWPEPKSLEEASFDRQKNPGAEAGGLANRILRPFCLGSIKTCDFISKKISSEHYYEEEDFVLSLYNRNLLSEFQTADVSRLLEAAYQEIIRLDASLQDPVFKALATRIEFRSKILRAVDIENIADRRRIDHWEGCINLLSNLRDTHSFGKAVPESFSVKVQRRLASTVPPRPVVDVEFEDAFDLLQRLCRDSRDAYYILDYFGGTQLQRFVWSFQSQTNQPPPYVRSLMQSLVFSDMKVLGSMSFKKLIFDSLEETVMPADAILDEANGAVEAPQDPRFQISRVMKEFLTKAADGYLDIFRTLCMNRSRLRRMLCHLVVDWDYIQGEAEGLDVELRKFTHEEPIREDGQELWAFPLSSWAYYHKLQQLMWIVQMGFELEIYQVDELGGMYWYLNHLALTLLAHLDRIHAFTVHRLSIPSPTPLTHSHRQSIRRTISFLDTAKAEISATASFALGLSQMYVAFSHLGFVRPAYQGYPYSDPKLRYELRMRPFLSISLPEVPSYEDFLANNSLPDLLTTTPTNPSIPTSPSTSTPPTDPPPASNRTKKKKSTKNKSSSIKPASTLRLESAHQLLQSADDALQAARAGWDGLSKLDAQTARCQGCEGWWRASVKDVLRSAIKACIGAATARKVVESVMDMKINKDADIKWEEVKTLLAEKMAVRVTLGDEDREAITTDEAKAEAKAKAKWKGKSKGKGKGRGYHDWWIVPDVVTLAK